ncbi:hypothetical protein CSKR_104737 [Clonorchis sinensis]|uniref:Uncharacterized protein n=1 Tax=Clonorchis sinensis TaxID=79923 RepID=A0A419PWS6_CLOSI|nr:hypothetical protein CSKR_104737 [Clonorchis sinensis]
MVKLHTDAQSVTAMLWTIGSSGALIDCCSVRRPWQLDCKRFITNQGDIISAGLMISPDALMMSPRLVMKRLQSNCQARRTDQQSTGAHKISRTISVLNEPYALTNYCLVALYRLSYFRLFVGIPLTLKFARSKIPYALQRMSKRNVMMTGSESCHGHILIDFIANIGRIVLRGSRKTSLPNRMTQHFVTCTLSAVQTSHFSQRCFRSCRSQLILTTNDRKATDNRKTNQ